MRWIAERWVALDLSFQDLHFYGGLALFAAAPGRWAFVGAVLALHAWLTPFLNGLTARRG